MVFSDGGYGGGGDCRSPCPSTTKRGSSEGGGVKVKEEPTTYEGDGSNSDGSSSSSSSSSSSTSSPKPTEDEAKRDVVNIKEERMDYLMDDEYEGIDCFINSGSRNYNNINTTTDGGSYSSPSSSSLVLPKPMECLLETGPPPFLNKTFQIVDDPETDPIVSWSEARQSFVVWDPHEFSKTLLPNYFKHSNFSSFIRQLNTYGFKKIDPDRWEFANEGFQGGKKHLLKSIKKRSRYRKQQQGSTVSANSTKKARLEEQLETLKKDQDVLKFEILNLKQQQKYSQHQLTAVNEQICSSECKQQRMMLFLTKVTKNCNFVQRIMHKRMLDGGDLGKRRRLLSAQGFENSGDCGTRVQVFDEQLPEEVVPQLEVTSLSASVLDKSCNQKPEADVLSVYDNMSDKLLQENSVFDNEFAVNDSNFYQELEDLITEPHELVDLNVKPCDWSGYVSNCLVEQAGCVGSMP